MYTVAKRFEFSASHRLSHLRGLDAEHPCCRLHGHNYTVEVQVTAAILGADGFVIDYRAMAPFKARVDALDHRDLNDYLGGGDSRATTAEGLALHFYREAVAVFEAAPNHTRRRVVAVRVSETGRTWAEYRP